MIDISSRAERRFKVARRVSAAAIVCVILPLASVYGQNEFAGERMKPGGPRARPICSVAKLVAAPSSDQRRRAHDLVQQGQQAAMLGDSPAELRALRDASALDPTDADLAYQLARAYETAKDPQNAVAEYCRFLSLAPTSPDASDVVEKVRSLTPPRPEQIIDLTLAVFRSGVSAYQRGQFAAADSAFTRSIEADAEWGDAYYNRALVRTARGDRDAARVDFARYLALEPDASDRHQVARLMAGLGPKPLSPLKAFAYGAVIPGGGQFYAHRPIRGVLTILGVAGASTAAALTKTVHTSSGSTRTERPYLISGIVTASFIGALSAFNAAAHVQSLEDVDARVGLSFDPGAKALAARVSLPSRW